MDQKSIINKIRIAIFVCAAIFIGVKYFMTGSLNKSYKLKEDISRVENEKNFSITFEELAVLLQEIDPKATIKKDDKAKTNDAKDGSKYFTQELTFKGSKILGYSYEEKGKLIAIEIYSGRGLPKGTKMIKDSKGIPRAQASSVEFKTQTTDLLKRNAAILNNILNPSTTEKELYKFLRTNIGKNIKTGVNTDVGDTTVDFYGDSRYYTLILSFSPKRNIQISTTATTEPASN